jgi:DNA-directed RNA polymerase subunit H (RpoH/RPB5)
MSVIPQLLPVEINQDKRRIEVLKNTVHMLTNRKLLKSDNLDDNIKKITALNSDDMIYPIILDNPEIYYPKGSNYKILYLKFINQKITGITKTSNIGEFLISKKDFPKIIVVSSISNKTEDQIRHDYPFTEIFMEKNLMIDIVKHISVPKHELLTAEQSKAVIEDYNTKKRELPKIYRGDHVIKYFNGQIGQIVKIIRPSEVSGLAPYYRLIIKDVVAK